MLKIQEIRELIKLVDQSSIEEFIFEHEGSKIQMKKAVLKRLLFPSLLHRLLRKKHLNQ